MPRGVSPLDEAQLQGRLWTPWLHRTFFWGDPDDVSTFSFGTGSSVSGYRDKKESGRNFSQANTANQVTRTLDRLNGRAVLTFNGSQWLTSVDPASTWNFLHTTNGSSMFAVWQAGITADPNAAYGLLGNSSILTANHGFGIIYDDRNSNARNNVVSAQIARGVSGQPTAGNATGNNAHPANTPVIIAHTSNPAASLPADRLILRINGTEIKNNALTNAASTANATFPLQIGAVGGNLFPLVGIIGEIVIVPFAVSAAAAQLFEGYLAWRSRLNANLTATHRFVNRPPLIGD
jgi:hypothetical protein